jgi:hypothetical protein
MKILMLFRFEIRQKRMGLVLETATDACLPPARGCDRGTLIALLAGDMNSRIRPGRLPPWVATDGVAAAAVEVQSRVVDRGGLH